MADFKPQIVEEAQAVRIHQGEYRLDGWPETAGIKNEWDFALGTVDGGLSSVNVPGEWRKNGDTYSRAGDGPVLTVVIDLGAGNLQIRE